MSAICPTYDGAPATIAQGLRAIDCSSGIAIQTAFGRFFGPDGLLGNALTILLTLYVALLAIKLLTGRGGMSISALTPRMLGLGLVLTFATSWVAYQTVVLNLALGAPDEVARILIGTKGNTTMVFADRLDSIFNAITSAAANAPPQLPGTVPSLADPPATASDLLWLAALMLLLGTVGILLVAKVALAAMLALGPIFIILALFSGTRGLFEGWLKAVVLFALTPLFAVLLGGGTIALIGPMVDQLGGGEPDMRLAVTIFLAASVHVALMLMALKASTTLVSGWRLPWPGQSNQTNADRADTQSPPANEPRILSPAMPGDSASSLTGDDRVQSIIAAIGRPANDDMTSSLSPTARAAAIVERVSRTETISSPMSAMTRTDERSRGIGQMFRKVTPSTPRKAP